MKKGLLFFAFFSALLIVKAQDGSLLNLLTDSLQENQAASPVKGTFKGLYIANLKSVENSPRGALNLLVMHRFGRLNDGAYNFFGLDNATIRIGFEYGITDNLAVGIGRSSYNKTFDGYFKYRLLTQTAGSRGIPVTMSLSSEMDVYSLRYPDKNYLNLKYRSSYGTSLMVARKFNHFSLQLNPAWIHYNLVPETNDKNDVFAIAAAGRLKLTNRMSLLGEYAYLLPGQIQSIDVHNEMSFAWEIETGGHVFELVFSNSEAMTSPSFIGRTTGKWTKGDIYFGFNISRVFNISKQSKGKIDYE